MIVQTNAIVLHRMKYKNSSLIARLFTKDTGKISIIINGARKQKGNVFGIIEPPNIIKLNYYQKKTGSLQIYKEGSFLCNNFLIREDILKLGVALFTVEIIDKTFHEYDVNPEVYDLVCKTLQTINDSTYDSRLILCFFLLKLIEELGFMIDLDNKENIAVPINNEIKLFLLSLNEYSINNLGNINYSNINLIEIITLLESYIKQHLKLNKDIQSLKMIKDLTYG